MGVQKLLGLIRRVILEGPYLTYYLLVGRIYHVRTLRAKAASCHYRSIRLLLLKLSGVRIGIDATVQHGVLIHRIGRQPPAVSIGDRAAVGPYVTFVSSATGIDRLWHVVNESSIFVSNTLPGLLAVTGVGLLDSYPGYTENIETLETKGIRSFRDSLPSCGPEIKLTYFDNLLPLLGTKTKWTPWFRCRWRPYLFIWVNHSLKKIYEEAFHNSVGK
jgi:hypothetical protein